MNNGIKPTRLWRLTGRKHYRRMIRDREEAFPPHNQRDKREVLRLLGIFSSSFVALGYTFGLFSPPMEDPIVEKPCVVKKRPAVIQDARDPCPREVPCPLPKCKKPSEDKDDRPVCKYD